MTNLYNTYNDNLAIAQYNECVKGYNSCIYISVEIDIIFKDIYTIIPLKLTNNFRVFY